jgi:aldose 1-epimerase
VENPDRVPLPFGLGYHPYLRVPLTEKDVLERCWVRAAADSAWELDESLPTSRRLPVDAGRDLRQWRPYDELHLDDVLTASERLPADADGLCWWGGVRQGEAGPVVNVRASPDFRELVAFTPPHRHAVALEPYTCTTDAINLEQRGIDAGWRVLPPGGTWAGIVEFSLTG